MELVHTRAVFTKWMLVSAVMSLGTQVSASHSIPKFQMPPLGSQVTGLGVARQTPLKMQPSRNTTTDRRTTAPHRPVNKTPNITNPPKVSLKEKYIPARNYFEFCDYSYYFMIDKA